MLPDPRPGWGGRRGRMDGRRGDGRRAGFGSGRTGGLGGGGPMELDELRTEARQLPAHLLRV